MKRTSGGQVSPDTAETEVFHAAAGRIIMGKGESRGLDVSTCLRYGKIKASVGGYEK